MTGLRSKEQYGYGVVDLSLASGALSGTSWLCGNAAQSIFRENIGRSSVRVVDVWEQSGYGVVDLAVDGHRMTGNHDGTLRGTLRVPAGRHCNGVSVREQGGYGIVNVRLIFDDGSTGQWALDNTAGTVLEQSLSAGIAMTGLRVKNQWGYGIIDIMLAGE